MGGRPPQMKSGRASGTRRPPRPGYSGRSRDQAMGWTLRASWRVLNDFRQGSAPRLFASRRPAHHVSVLRPRLWTPGRNPFWPCWPCPCASSRRARSRSRSIPSSRPRGSVEGGPGRGRSRIRPRGPGAGGTASRRLLGTVAAQVPNFRVEAAGTSSFGAIYGLRGLANTPYFSDPAITVYFDDIPLAGSFSYPTDLFGFASWQAVYRGPSRRRSGARATAESSCSRRRAPMALDI